MLSSKHIIEKCSAPVSMTNISSKIQGADKEKKNTISKETELPASPLRPRVMVEDPASVAMESCSIGKSQISKRKREDRKLPSAPSRSSKRLAGVDAQVVFHRIPVEHSLRASNRKSKGTKSVSSLVSLSNDLQEKPGLPNADTPKALTCQEAEHHTLDIDTQSVLATEEKHGKNSNCLMQDDPDVVDLQEQTRPGKSTDEVLSENIRQSPKDPGVTMPDSLMQDDPPGISGNVTHEVLPKCIRQSSKDPRVTVPDSLMQDSPSCISGNLIDELLPESIGQSSKEPRVTVPDSLMHDGPPVFSGNLTDAVLYNNIARLLKDPRATVPDNFMQEVPYNFMQDDSLGFDLLLDQPPPGFSGCLIDQVSKSMVQSNDPTHSMLVSEMDVIPSDHSTAQGQSNALHDSKVEKPAADLPVIKEQLGSITNATDVLLDRKAKKPAAGFPVTGEQPGSITGAVDPIRDFKVEKPAPGFSMTNEQPGSITVAVDALRDSKVKKPAAGFLVTEKISGSIPKAADAPLDSKVQKPAAFQVTEEQPGSIPKAAEASMPDFNFPAPLWSDPCLEFAYKTLTGAIPLDSQPVSIPKVAEPPVSDFNFPAPLWSDPCLEFAYKTLTGAIPLDDNLAVDDYIQHQLRTSQSNEYQSLPDIDVPSFFRND